MPTMTHTPAQRKAWHAGKRRYYETQGTWLHRVLNKGRNLRGAYTPAWMKKRLPHKSL